jgi:hypothetical protein
MRSYKTIFSAYQNQDIDREFFSNTTVFFNGVDVGLPSFTIINNIFTLENRLVIKGGKNEIDVTRYDINTLDANFMGKRCIVLNKIYN